MPRAGNSAALDLATLDPDAIHDDYERHRLEELSDAALFELAAETVSIPKPVAADSFRLHAPLELLARRALLGYADPTRREAVRERMIWVAASYARSEAAADPGTNASDGPATDTTGLPMARDAIVASLAAAGHASIYLFLLPRIAPRSRAAMTLAVPLARELARETEWKIEWIDRHPPARPNHVDTGDAHDLARALLATPRLGLPGSDFIYPIVHQVDSTGVAQELLDPIRGAATDGEACARAIARVAAWSMLQDDPAAAPYGWTHCLTIPQAIAGIASTTNDPARAVLLAATHVVGFRAALGAATVADGYAPEPVGVGAVEGLDAPAPIAAAAAYHARAADHDAIVTELATRAALHPDAHVAKYTLACFDAAHADSQHRSLFLAAAAYLHGWWAHNEGAG